MKIEVREDVKTNSFIDYLLEFTGATIIFLVPVLFTVYAMWV